MRAYACAKFWFYSKIGDLKKISPSPLLVALKNEIDPRYSQNTSHLKKK